MLTLRQGDAKCLRIGGLTADDLPAPTLARVGRSLGDLAVDRDPRSALGEISEAPPNR